MVYVFTLNYNALFLQVLFLSWYSLQWLHGSKTVLHSWNTYQVAIYETRLYYWETGFGLNHDQAARQPSLVLKRYLVQKPEETIIICLFSVGPYKQPRKRNNKNNTQTDKQTNTETDDIYTTTTNDSSKHTSKIDKYV